MGKYKGNAAEALFTLKFTVLSIETSPSKTTVYEILCRTVNLHEKPLNFSIKTYLKNYLSKTGVFDIIMVSAREQTRQPKGREG